MRRRSASGGTCRTSSPPTRIVPASDAISRLIIRNVVDLPQPEEPSSTQNAPAGTVSDRPSTTAAAVVGAW